MIVTTDAIVLNARKFRESSKLVTLMTREQGKLGVVARGVSSPKSKFGSVLQPMSFVTATVYVKEGRELQNLTNAETIERWSGLGERLERMAAGMAIVELVNASVQDSDRNDHLFEATAEALRTLNRIESHETIVLGWFMMQMADALGYALRTDECGVCDEPLGDVDGSVAYSLAVGAPLCAEHRQAMASRIISRRTYNVLSNLLGIQCAQATSMADEPAVLGELNDVLYSFLRYHIDGMRRLKVAAVSMQMLGTPASM